MLSHIGRMILFENETQILDVCLYSQGGLCGIQGLSIY